LSPSSVVCSTITTASAPSGAANDGGERKLARVEALDDLQRSRRSEAGRRGVRGNQGIPVHRGARERRHVERRDDVFRCNSSGRALEPDPFGARDWPDAIAQPGLSFCERDGGCERAHF
jgi:hypothetical protein